MIFSYLLLTGGLVSIKGSGPDEKKITCVGIFSKKLIRYNDIPCKENYKVDTGEKWVLNSVSEKCLKFVDRFCTFMVVSMV